MSVLRGLVQLVLVAAALAGGAVGARWFLTHRVQARRVEPQPKALLVEVIPARASDQPVGVWAMGTVVPAVQIELQPEVSGRIIEQHPELLVGGRFGAGDTIIQIDRKDYEFAVESQKAAVEKALFDLKVEEGRATIARREWKLLDRDVKTTEAGRALALREPHLRNAQAALAAAKSALEKAQLDLARTTLRAPFNALVLKESVDVGQLVSPQTRLATLVGTDEFHVQVLLPVDRLNSVRIPGINGSDGDGSLAQVVHSVGNGTRLVHEGRVVRLLGDITQGGRMAQLLVAVEDPLDLKRPREQRRLPMLLGAYVRVEMEGKELKGVFEVPRRAIREGNRVWVMDEGDRLAIRPVTIAWGRPDTVLVRDGLREGDRIVVSRIATPIQGTRLRVPRPEGQVSTGRARR